MGIESHSHVLSEYGNLCPGLLSFVHHVRYARIYACTPWVRLGRIIAWLDGCFRHYEGPRELLSEHPRTTILLSHVLMVWHHQFHRRKLCNIQLTFCYIRFGLA